MVRVEVLGSSVPSRTRPFHQIQAMSASAAPRASLLPLLTASGPVYGGAYDCLVCGVSVRRTSAPALRCARCPCRPFHRACAPPGSPGARACPQ